MGDGLIDRHHDTADGRQSVLRLTEAGRAALAADMALRDHWLSDALGGLPATELGVLALAAPIIERIGDPESPDDDNPSQERDPGD